MYAKREFEVDNTNWVHVVLPPRGMAKIKRIVISQGLELDNLRLYMEFPVVMQYVRLQDSDLDKLEEIIQEGLLEIHNMGKSSDT